MSICDISNRSPLVEDFNELDVLPPKQAIFSMSSFFDP